MKWVKMESKEANATWARVELHRWQHGNLPYPGYERPLDVVEGVTRMADAIEKGDLRNFPTPFNVVSVLRYLAYLLKSDGLKVTKP